MKDIQLDKDVIGSDGNKVGTVDRIIIHPETLEVDGFVVHEGIIFTHDRIVEETFVERIDAEHNVVLNITSEQEAELPELASRRVTEPEGGILDRLAEMNYMATPSATGQVLVLSEPVDDRFAPAPDSPLQPAPSNPPIVTEQTNLPEGTVTLKEGTDVVDVDGQKIGSIDEIIYDDQDQLTSLVVEDGLIFKHHFRIPAAWIESMTHVTVTLNRSAEEVRESGKVD